MASRTAGRLTPSAAASSRSAGSRSPAWRRPGRELGLEPVEDRVRGTRVAARIAASRGPVGRLRHAATSRSLRMGLAPALPVCTVWSDHMWSDHNHLSDHTEPATHRTIGAPVASLCPLASRACRRATSTRCARSSAPTTCSTATATSSRTPATPRRCSGPARTRSCCPRPPPRWPPILRARHRSSGIPVMPRGAGSNLAAATVAEHGGIVLVLTRMNRILEVSARRAARRRRRPGVTTAALADAAAAQGLLYPPDPGSRTVSTVGGNVATCAGGLRGLKYGVTRNYVLGLRGRAAHRRGDPHRRPAVEGRRRATTSPGC